MGGEHRRDAEHDARQKGRLEDRDTDADDGDRRGRHDDVGLIVLRIVDRIMKMLARVHGRLVMGRDAVTLRLDHRSSSGGLHLVALREARSIPKIDTLDPLEQQTYSRPPPGRNH